MERSKPYTVVMKKPASLHLRSLPLSAFVGVRRVLSELATALGEGLTAVEGAIHHLELAGRVPPGCSKLRYSVDPQRRTVFVLELGR